MMDVKKIREDFPILDLKVRGKPIIYFDNACVSLKPRQVVEAMNRYYYEFTACHGRSIHYLSKYTTAEYEKARQKIAEFIGAQPNEIIFTKNTTEAINIVANGLDLVAGDKVITTNLEHNSGLLPWRMLAEKGIKHEMVLVDENGEFNMEEFEKKIDKKTKIVSVIHSSNVMGTTMPIEDICKIAHDYGALVLADGAQTVPHKEINVRKLRVDFYAFSGHKMLGPSGTGALYGRFDFLEKLKPLMYGGETVKNVTKDKYEFEEIPQKFEAGLQNYAGAIGFGAAVDYLNKIKMCNIEKHDREIVKEMLTGFENVPVKLYGPKKENRGPVFAFNLPGLPAHEVAIMLDEIANIYVRSGMHCTHMYHQEFLGANTGTVRASTYLYNTKEEVTTFFEILGKIAKQFS